MRDAINSNSSIDISNSDYIEDQEKFIKIRIEVIDTGVGIKKENLNKLFMDFSRLDEHQKMNS